MVYYPNASVYWLNGPCYNLTNQCSNNCRFCFRNWNIYRIEATNSHRIKEVYNLRLEVEATFDEITTAMLRLMGRFQGTNYEEFIICGQGEPTKRLELLLKLIVWTQSFYRNPVRLVTNGQANLLNLGVDVVKTLREADLRNPKIPLKISISLNGHDQESYIRNCNPEFGKLAFPEVLKFAERVLEVFGEENVEITSVMTNGVSVREIEKLAGRMGYTNFRKRPEISIVW